MPSIDDIKTFHLDSSPAIALLETIEINHSAWDKPIRIVTNHADGLSARNELGQYVVYDFAPLLISKGETSDNLDQSLKITLGDLGEVVPPLIDKIRQQDSDESPQVTYRAYVFDAGAMQLVKETPIDIIKGLTITSMSRDVNATTFEAKTEDKNTLKTGRIYNSNDYPDLKGLL